MHKEAIEIYEEILKTQLNANDNNNNTSNDKKNNNNSNSQQQLDSNSKSVDNSLRAKVYRQLGWLYFCSEYINKLTAPENSDLQTPINLFYINNDNNNSNNKSNVDNNLLKIENINRRNLSIATDYLTKSSQLDSTQYLTWQYLGHVIACTKRETSARQAFEAYTQNIVNRVPNGDTWCSIGVLYCQQKQYKDALPAFICSIQLDRYHYVAWFNLGIIYEQHNQLDEALKCYRSAVRCKVEQSKQIMLPRIKFDDCDDESKPPAAKKPFIMSNDLSSTSLDLENALDACETDEKKQEFQLICERIKLLSVYFQLMAELKKDGTLITRQPHSMPQPNLIERLPSLHEAFLLPIPTDCRRRILNSNQINLQNHNPYYPHTVYFPNDIFLNNNNKSNTVNTKKVNSLSPQQVDLMNNLESNKQHLNAEQTQMLNHLKKQYSLTKEEKEEEEVGQGEDEGKGDIIIKTKTQNGTLKSLEITKQLQLTPPTQITIKDDTMNDETMLLKTCHTIQQNLFQDFGPVDFYPTMCADENTDNIYGILNPNRPLIPLPMHVMQTFPVAQIKIDTSLTEDARYISYTTMPKFGYSQSTTTAQPQQIDNKNDFIMLNEPESGDNNNETNSNDDEILAAKLNINMSGDEILKECASFGLNGLQYTSYLKPNRLNEPQSFTKATDELVLDKNDHSDNKIDESLPHGSQSTFNFYNSFIKRNETANTLTLPGPSLQIEIKRDCHSPHLQYFCQSNPITVIRGMSTVLRLDLSLFSTKTILDVDSDLIVDIHTQRLFHNVEDNFEYITNGNGANSTDQRQVWKSDLETGLASITNYAQYQALTFQETVAEEKTAKPNEIIKPIQPLNSNNKDYLKEFNDNVNSIVKSIKDGTKFTLPSPIKPTNNTTITKTSNKSLNQKKKSDLSEAPSDANQKPQHKKIKTATNVDLSDETKWRAQLAELAKLPSFMRCISAGNMLSHLGYNSVGLNSIKVRLNVPGSRVTGHQQSNNFSSININIGPGECEWLAVSYKYWPKLEALCERNGINFDTESWWPNLDELKAAKIPVYRFVQRPGDVVWINWGCVHWMHSAGWSNNVSWCVGPLVYDQYRLAIEKYELNRLKFNKSLVPMIHLSWNIARNVRITDRRLYEYIRFVLMQSLKQCQLAFNYAENCGVESKLRQQRLSDTNETLVHYCYDCNCEVFNILFVSESSSVSSQNQQEKLLFGTNDHPLSVGNNSDTMTTNTCQFTVHCQVCARKRNHLLDSLVIIHQFTLDDLKQVYNQFQLFVPTLQTLVNNISNSK
jgi:tetratricopeptide (TPR) repeat protein